jgi:hypothetical protein
MLDCYWVAWQLLLEQKIWWRGVCVCGGGGEFVISLHPKKNSFVLRVDTLGNKRVLVHLDKAFASKCAKRFKVIQNWIKQS